MKEAFTVAAEGGDKAALLLLVGYEIHDFVDLRLVDAFKHNSHGLF